MKLLLGIATVAACVGCAPITPSRPVEADVPIVATCRVAPVECGPYALSQVSPGDRLIVKGRAALAEIKQREACELRLRAALKACTDSPQ